MDLMQVGTVVYYGDTKCVVIGSAGADENLCACAFDGAVYYVAAPTYSLRSTEEKFTSDELAEIKRSVARRCAMERACPSLWHKESGLGSCIYPISGDVDSSFLEGFEEQPFNLIKAGTYVDIGDRCGYIIGYDVLSPAFGYIVVARQGEKENILASIPLDSVKPVEPWVETDDALLTEIKLKLAPWLFRFRHDAALAAVLMRFGVISQLPRVIPAEFADECLALAKSKEEDELALAAQVDEVFIKKDV